METRIRDRTAAAREAWRLMFELAAAKRARLSAQLVELDLTPVQAHALRYLEPKRPLPMSELADALYCHASNVTGIVDRLELRGIVERRPDPEDRRVKTLVLTGAGADIRARVLELMGEPPEGVARLSGRDQRLLRDILRRAVGR